VVAARVGTD